VTDQTQFGIRENRYGEHEVIELVPEVLGTFPDRFHADLFYDALLKGDVAVSGDPTFGVSAFERWRGDAEAVLDEALEEFDLTTGQPVEATAEPRVSASVTTDGRPAQDLPPATAEALANMVEAVVQAEAADEASATDAPPDPATERAVARKDQLARETAAKMATVKAASAEDNDPKKPAPDDPIWVTALDRVAGGQTVKEVAASLDLPFPSLRAKWGAAVKAGKHKGKTPKATLKTSRDIDPDGPVSGGVGAALKRSSRRLTFTGLQDDEIIKADPSDYPRMAKSFGVPVERIAYRAKALAAQITKLMSEEDTQ